ncbi:MAG: glycoside hydrolase family 99-like domain-containing protein, partial [Ktedonobacteraceae bacterium]
PEVKKVTDLWREMAEKSGLKGLYLVGYSWHPSFVPQDHGFDGLIAERIPDRDPLVSPFRRPIKWLSKKFRTRRGKPTVYSYQKILPELLKDNGLNDGEYPCIIPNWDNTPRSGRNGLVLKGSTPELFRSHLKKALQSVQNLPYEHRLIFVKSWNEWAEGNHLEPDLRFGKGYLQVLKEEIETNVPQ